MSSDQERERAVPSVQPKLIALVVLSGVLILVYARAFRPAPHADAPPTVPVAQPAAAPGPAPTASSTEAAVSSPARAASRDAQRRRATSLPWSRDPFARVVVGVEGNALALSGILWDSRQPLAIINGQVLRVGEELEGYRVVEISPDRVSVTDGTTTRHLHLIP